MLTTTDYAEFAANAYAASQNVISTINTVPLPDGWSPLNEGVARL